MMDGQDNRLLLERYLAGLLDAEQEYALRHEDVVIDMPQSGERIRGRDHMKAMQEAYPGPPTITVRRVVGSGDVWVVEGRSDYGGRIYHITNILEFREGKIIRETRYYADSFQAPAWRAQWVEPIEKELEKLVRSILDELIPKWYAIPDKHQVKTKLFPGRFRRLLWRNSR
jgi:hypothetical protein